MIGPAIALVTAALAAPGTLGGVVSGLDTGAPVAGAEIIVYDELGDAYTELSADAMGVFGVELPEGTWLVSVWAPGFDRIAYEETVADDTLVEVRYKLRPATEGLVITASREREEVSRTVITTDELKSVPGTLGDPVRALQSLPGVARPSAVEGDIVVRGAEASNTGYRVDGMRVPYMFHLLAGRSVINPAFIDDVEFFPGGMPPRFGESLQATVNIRTNQEQTDVFRGRVTLDVLDGSFGFESPLGERATISAGGRYSWVSVFFQAQAGAQDGDRSDTVLPKYGDGFVDLHLQLNAEHALSWTTFGSRDAFIFRQARAPESDETLPFDPTFYVDSYFVRSRLRWDFDGDNAEHATWISYGPDQQQNLLTADFSFGEGPVQGRVQGTDLVFRHDHTRRPGDRLTVNFGTQFAQRPVYAEDYSDVYEGPANPVIYTTDEQVTASAWTELRIRAGAWQVAPGLRTQAYLWKGQRDLEPEPRLSLRRTLSESWTAKAFVGRFTQIPPLERYAAGMGNPTLELQTSAQSLIGLEGQIGSGFFVDSSLYYTDMFTIVVEQLEVDVQSDGTESKEVLVPVFGNAEGYAFGWEGLVRLYPENLPVFGWVSLTLGRTVRTLDGVTYFGDKDQPLGLTVLAAWDTPIGLQISGRYRFTSGHPFTPYSGVYNPEAQVYEPLPGLHNSDRFPDFQQLDLRVQKSWLGRRIFWTVFLDVLNATNAKNAFAASYDYDYEELVPVFYVPVLPILGMEAEF